MHVQSLIISDSRRHMGNSEFHGFSFIPSRDNHPSIRSLMHPLTPINFSLDCCDSIEKPALSRPETVSFDLIIFRGGSTEIILVQQSQSNANAGRDQSIEVRYRCLFRIDRSIYSSYGTRIGLVADPTVSQQNLVRLLKALKTHLKQKAITPIASSNNNNNNNSNSSNITLTSSSIKVSAATTTPLSISSTLTNFNSSSGAESNANKLST